MKLPRDVSIRILQKLGMPDLDNKTKVAYIKKLQSIRREMRRLASDFAAYLPSEHKYSDAYLAYNFPMNVTKTMVVVQEVMQYYPELLAGKDRWHVLDIGCGDGAGMLGAYYMLKDLGEVRAFDVLGIDDSAIMLKHARAVARWQEEKDPRLRIRFRVQRIDQDYRRVGQKYDIILCVNSLAEIIQQEEIPKRFISSMVDSLVDNGLIVIIEPALKKYAHRLMNLRDTLRMQHGIQLLLPCLHNGLCPLLSINKQKEWCHQSVSWSPPGFLEIINQGLNREIDVLKFAYLVVAKSKAQQNKPDGYRVVSHLLKEKGRQRCFLCTSTGRVELVKLDKSHNSYNMDFDTITLGSIVTIKDVRVKKNNYWQVTEDTNVQIVK